MAPLAPPPPVPAIYAPAKAPAQTAPLRVSPRGSQLMAALAACEHLPRHFYAKGMHWGERDRVRIYRSRGGGKRRRK